MSRYIRVTATCYASSGINDILALEGLAQPTNWVSTNFAFGVSVTFDIPAGTWPRVRNQLQVLAQRRVPIADLSTGVMANTGKTMPMITYSADWLGGRPRILQVEAAELSLATPTTVTLRGENLLAGQAASKTIRTASPATVFAYPGTRSYALPQDVLRFTAVAKGPVGNLIAYRIMPASGAGSVTVVLGADGVVQITIVPAAGASNSTAIAAQIAGSTNASAFITATALVASQPIAPTRNPAGLGVGMVGSASYAGQPEYVNLEGGCDGGLAVLDVPVDSGVPTNRLRLTATRGGSDANFINFTLNVSQGANTVVVSGNNITVNRTGATETIANIVTAINASAPAAALVTASAVGSGALGAITKTFLYGGSGESPVATIGGATTSITSHTDSVMTLVTTNAALLTAGVAAAEAAAISIRMNYGLVNAQVLMVT